VDKIEGHDEEVVREDDVTGCHQRATECPRQEIGRQDLDGVHERPRGIEHVDALQDAADRQEDEVDPKADRCQPEV
jgi:hypothetical protein